MKFIMHLTPAVLATPEERERLAPIAHRTDKTQELLEEMVDLARFAEEVHFDALSYYEHHFYAQGLEAGATLYSEAAEEAGHNSRMGQNIGLARLVYIGKTREQALQRAHDGNIFLFSQFHAKFAPEIPTTVEPLIEAGIAFVGTIDDVKQQMYEVKEKLDPDWFMLLSDQGFLPRDEIKEQMDLFGQTIIQEFSD